MPSDRGVTNQMKFFLSLTHTERHKETNTSTLKLTQFRIFKNHFFALVFSFFAKFEKQNLILCKFFADNDNVENQRKSKSKKSWNEVTFLAMAELTLLMTIEFHNNVGMKREGERDNDHQWKMMMMLWFLLPMMAMLMTLVQNGRKVCVAGRFAELRRVLRVRMCECVSPPLNNQSCCDKFFVLLILQMTYLRSVRPKSYVFLRNRRPITKEKKWEV